ncbi:MAG: serine hydrolase [Chthonomonadales bacterium]|nr:serine hydrolase [Chthonomonadales bacterium]
MTGKEADLEALRRTIGGIAGHVPGRLGVCVRDLVTGSEIGVRADEPLPMASVCKLPVLVSAYRAHEAGRLNLGERVELDESCRCDGSGLFNAFDLGLRPTVHDLLLMMIVVSDNAATDLVVERLTPAAVTSDMRALGLSSIRVDRLVRDILRDLRVYVDPRYAELVPGKGEELLRRYPDLKAKEEDPGAWRNAANATIAQADTATPRDIARLCAQIAGATCASAASCEAMLAILGEQQLNGRLPRDLPQGTSYRHKTGTIGGGSVVNDAGLLYLDDVPVAAVAVLSRDVRGPIYRTNAAIARIGRAVCDHYRMAHGGRA